MLTHLRALYGPAARWKSDKQYTTLKQLLALENDVIVADCTGGGKTAVAILPSFVENGYTVIVVPLVALKEDWIRRLDSFGVKYEHFEGAKSLPTLHGKHNIILVSSDVVVGTRWKNAIQQLHSLGKPVLRFVVDEVHYYFVDVALRKRALQYPFLLRLFPFQMVLMSATIPYQAEEFLNKHFLLANPTRVSGISDRHELGIRIHELQSTKKMTEWASKLIKHHLGSSTWRPESRFLVFVNTYQDGVELAKDLGLPFYHSSSDEYPIEDGVRQQMYKDWVKGKGGQGKEESVGMVVTSSLGAGNDSPHVHFTIHYQAPYNLVTFEQQRTRAGRDGRASANYVLILPYPRAPKPVDPDYPEDLAGAQEMSDLLYAKRPHPQSCLAYGMTSFLDGAGVTCLQLGRKNVCKACTGSKSLHLKEEQR
jgi:superfamily II DNA helicase RecQ